MGRVIVVQFMTVDGVVEDPVGSDGTDFGGWAMRHGPQGIAGDKFRLGPILNTGTLLLGRRTWEHFSTPVAAPQRPFLGCHEPGHQGRRRLGAPGPVGVVELPPRRRASGRVDQDCQRSRRCRGDRQRVRRHPPGGRRPGRRVPAARLPYGDRSGPSTVHGAPLLRSTPIRTGRPGRLDHPHRTQAPGT